MIDVVDRNPPILTEPRDRDLSFREIACHIHRLHQTQSRWGVSEPCFLVASQVILRSSSCHL